MIAWTLFTNPITLSSDSQLWLLAPLCLGVAVIYKAVRVEDLRRLPLQVAGLLAVYMVGGLIALGVLLWLLHEYWPF